MTATLRRCWPPEKLTDLVGIAFAFGGRGPDAIDCEGVVRLGLRLLFGIEWEEQGAALLDAHRRGDLAIPSCFPGDAWSILPASEPPRPGDVLVIGTGEMARHVALVIDGTHILQAAECYRSFVGRLRHVRGVVAVARHRGVA